MPPSAAVAMMVRASTAIFGLAIAIAIGPRLQFRAAAGDLPGALPAEGLSPRGPLLQWIAIIVLPFLFALGANLIVPKLRESRWATVAYCVVMALAPLPLMHFGNLRHVILHGVVAALVVIARNRQPHFGREDVVLLPVVLSMYLALLDVGFGKTPAATFLRAAIIVFALRLFARSPRAFALAPLALLLQMGWFARPVAGTVAIIWVVASAIALTASRAFDGVRGRNILTYVVYPLALPAYALALLGLFSPAPVDFFEDGHDLLPAAEMLRGEIPYRDILPTHGLISDGALSWLVLASGNDSIGSALAVRRAVAALNLTAGYFVVLAATGSAEASVLATLLTLFFFPGSSIFLRTAPALGALAAACAAVRLRSRRWLFVATALCGVSFLVSIDFAIYSSLVTFIAAARARVWRVPAILAVFVAAAFVLFWPVLGAASAFVIGPLEVPHCLRNLSALAAFSSDPHCLSAAVWILAVIVTAATLAARPLRASRRDAVLLIAMWVVVAGLSYVERRHLYYEFAVAPLIAGWLWQLRQKRYAAVLIILVVVLARPFSHVFDVATNMRRQSDVQSNAVASLPRTAGGIFEDHVRRGLETAQRFELKPGETYYDFANAPILYYFLDRDCPIRWAVLPFYEPEASQREVVATLERNQKITAVLMAFPGDFSNIDHVANRDRVPLVRDYVEKNFEPSFDEAGVRFWRRKRVPNAGVVSLPRSGEGLRHRRMRR